MTTTSTILAGALALAPPLAGPAEVGPPVDAPSADSLEARVWLDRGVDPVLQAGDLARIYYRASVDAYLVLFHIDTDGGVRLLSPGAADDPHRVRGGQDYRLLFPDSADWVVRDPPGVGYFFALASDRPFDFEWLDRASGGALPELAQAGGRAYEDPHVTMDRVITTLLPEVDTHDFALDFTAYHVGEAYSYPRFLCYACHAPQPVEVWNPYHRTCRGYRVVIHNDAYYYPAGRYRGDRVVFPRPPERGLPQFGFQERGPADPGTPLVVNRPGRTAPARALGVRTDGGELDDGFPTIRDGIGPTDGSDLPIGSLPVVGGEPSDDAVRTRPILQRRPPR